MEVRIPYKIKTNNLLANTDGHYKTKLTCYFEGVVALTFNKKYIIISICIQSFHRRHTLYE